MTKKFCALVVSVVLVLTSYLCSHTKDSDLTPYIKKLQIHSLEIFNEVAASLCAVRELDML